MGLIDYKDARPIFEQIADYYEKLITIGAIEPDTKITSVRNLSMELSINPNTVQKAYGELERRGYIYTVPGKGAFVNFDRDKKDEKKQSTIEKIKELLLEAREIGITEEEIKDIFCREGKQND